MTEQMGAAGVDLGEMENVPLEPELGDDTGKEEIAEAVAADAAVTEEEKPESEPISMNHWSLKRLQQILQRLKKKSLKKKRQQLKRRPQQKRKYPKVLRKMLNLSQNRRLKQKKQRQFPKKPQ